MQAQIDTSLPTASSRMAWCYRKKNNIQIYDIQNNLLYPEFSGNIAYSRKNSNQLFIYSALLE